MAAMGEKLALTSGQVPERCSFTLHSIRRSVQLGGDLLKHAFVHIGVGALG